MREPSVEQLGEEQFVALTTFKRNGEGVSTPMWIAREGSELLAWTSADSWKVKRVRRDPRVTLQPCTRMGKVTDGTAHVEGRAEVVFDPARVEQVKEMIRRKYGWGFRVVTFIERVAGRGRPKDRVVLAIALEGR